MSIKKYFSFCTIIAAMIFSQSLFAQETDSSDTIVLSETDIKYDSILAKATAALTASAYDQAAGEYRQASALKPQESYPYKMIKYVEDLAARQKRADELKRKARITNDLVKANQAIVNADWGNAKTLFNEILSLQPNKTDEDFARSKIAAIDLELQRIALRTPPPPAPTPVYVPKNRREARALRKVQERNAAIAATKGIDTTLSSSKAVSPSVSVTASNSDKHVQEKTTAALPKAKPTATAPVPVAKETRPMPAPTPVAATNQPVAADSAKKILQNTAVPVNRRPFSAPAVTTTPQESLPASHSANRAKDVQPNLASAPATQPTVTAPQAQVVQHKPQQPKRALPHPRTTVTTPSPIQTQPKPAQTALPATPVTTTAPVVKEVPSKPQPASLPPADATPTANTPENTPPKPADLSQLKLSDSSNYVKLICQDISFIGTNAYIKVLIQNYSPTTEFRTDTLHVSIVKNNGVMKQLDQRFISNFPVVKPLQESMLVSFSDVTASAEPDDIFIIEMKDRMRKTKLTVQVLWSLYLRSKDL